MLCRLLMKDFRKVDKARTTTLQYRTYDWDIFDFFFNISSVGDF